MFGNQEIEEDLFIEELSKSGQVHVLKKSKNIFITTVNNIKVDFVNYKYPFIDEIKIIETIRIASKKEIAAMKLNAIAGRGSKKDFIDLFFLTKSYSLKEMMEFYTQKYNDGSEFMVLKSLTYFEDADQEQTPKMFNNFDWNYCKETIENEFIKLNQ